MKVLIVEDDAAADGMAGLDFGQPGADGLNWQPKNGHDS